MFIHLVEHRDVYIPETNLYITFSNIQEYKDGNSLLILDTFFSLLLLLFFAQCLSR